MAPAGYTLTLPIASKLECIHEGPSRLNALTPEQSHDRHRGVPTVGVVVPAYNAAKTLTATLESVRSQTLRDFEVVIVDDGSTDSTFEIASRFAAMDARFSVARQPNSGVADARNAGIRAIRAPLVAALDADDIWHPTFLEKLSAALREAGDETVLAYANVRVIDPSGYVAYDAPRYGQAGWVFNQLLLTNFIGNGSAMMFRRALAVQVGAYERRLQHELATQGAEDWLLALRLAARGRAVAVREYLVGYRSAPGAMSANTLRMRRSRLHALEILYAEIEPPKTPAARWALGIAHGKCFLHELRARQLRNAFRSLLRALRFDPLGTCDLLFGRERWAWLKSVFATTKHVEPRAFAELDPRDGCDEHFSERLDRAREWDAKNNRAAVSRHVPDSSKIERR
jgi:glycosyltransferase involved in cell wall biosynthesis